VDPGLKGLKVGVGIQCRRIVLESLSNIIKTNLFPILPLYWGRHLSRTIASHCNTLGPKSAGPLGKFPNRRGKLPFGVDELDGMQCERPPLCWAHRPPRPAIGPQGWGGYESAPVGRWGWAIGRVSPRVRTAIRPYRPPRTPTLGGKALA